MKWQVSGNEQLTNKQTIDRNPANLMKNMQHVNTWISCLLLFSIKSHGKWNMFCTPDSEINPCDLRFYDISF